MAINILLVVLKKFLWFVVVLCVDVLLDTIKIDMLL